MEMNRRMKNPHRANTTIDLLHIVICVAIIVLAVLGFLKPAENMKLFCVIFALASVLNFINGVPRLKRVRGQQGRFFSGLFLCAVAVVLLVLAVVSAIAFW